MRKLRHGAYILARYSTDRQNPDSIEVQVDGCTAWCQREGIPVLDVFADYAISGMKDTRPEYERMIHLLKTTDAADTVIIYDQSRMFRGMVEWFQFRDQLEALGRRVVSVTQPFVGGDLLDPNIFMAEGAQALINQMWVLQTRQKVIAKMEFMARNGQFTGGRAYYGTKVENKRRVIREDEAPVVVRIFKRQALGDSYRKISSDLAEDGIFNRSGKPFGVNEIHDILNREEYLGILIYGKSKRTRTGRQKIDPENQIRIANALPAIINQELWDAAHAKMQTHKRTGGRKYKKDYLLKGKVFCGSCGGAITLTYSQNQKYAYYRCCRKDRDHSCDSRQIKAEVLEKTVSDAVRAQLGSPENRKKILDILAQHRSQVMSSAGIRVPQLEAQIADTRKKLDNATDAVLQGLTSQSLIDKIKALEAHLSGLQYQLQTIKSQEDAVDIDDATLSRLLDDMMADQSSTALLSIVARVEVHPNTIKIWTILDNFHPDGPHDSKDFDYPPVNTNNCSARVTGTRKEHSFWGALFLYTGEDNKRCLS